MVLSHWKFSSQKTSDLISGMKSPVVLPIGSYGYRYGNRTNKVGHSGSMRKIQVARPHRPRGGGGRRRGAGGRGRGSSLRQVCLPSQRSALQICWIILPRISYALHHNELRNSSNKCSRHGSVTTNIADDYSHISGGS